VRERVIGRAIVRKRPFDRVRGKARAKQRIIHSRVGSSVKRLPSPHDASPHLLREDVFERDLALVDRDDPGLFRDVSPHPASNQISDQSRGAVTESVGTSDDEVTRELRVIDLPRLLETRADRLRRVGGMSCGGEALAQFPPGQRTAREQACGVAGHIGR